MNEIQTYAMQRQLLINIADLIRIQSTLMGHFFLAYEDCIRARADLERYVEPCFTSNPFIMVDRCTPEWERAEQKVKIMYSVPVTREAI